MYNMMYILSQMSRRWSMGRMVRKQIYLSSEQERLLKRRAAELGVTESALIRGGIDRTVQLDAAETDRENSSEEAWRDALQLMRERARIEAAKERRGWTREELHEGQPEYLPG